MPLFKGFSLVEVLVSLMLVAIVALALIQQQCQTYSLMHQLLLRTQASQLLDDVEETLTSSKDAIPEISEPYHLEIKLAPQHLTLHINWFYDSLERNYEND